MSETSGEEMGNFNLNKQRQSLFSLIGHVLTVSKDKFDKEKACNGDRLKWGRLIVQGVEAYGRLLEGVQIEQLEERIRALEENKKEEEKA